MAFACAPPALRQNQVTRYLRPNQSMAESPAEPFGADVCANSGLVSSAPCRRCSAIAEIDARTAAYKMQCETGSLSSSPSANASTVSSLDGMGCTVPLTPDHFTHYCVPHLQEPDALSRLDGYISQRNARHPPRGNMNDKPHLRSVYPALSAGVLPASDSRPTYKFRYACRHQHLPATPNG